MNLLFSGKTDGYSAENDENCSPSSSALAKYPVRGTCLMKTATKSPVFDLYPGKILHPSAKIKLQLFPIDEKTRMGLEKVICEKQSFELIRNCS